MGNEITLRVKCKKEEFCNILENKGFKLIDRFTLEDIYFVPYNIDIQNITSREILKFCVLIRHFIGYIPSEYHLYQFTYKIKEINKAGEIINQNKVDCEIKNIEAGIRFLNAIGYNKLMQIKENDLVYEKFGLQIELKDIENGDTLIEIETVENNEELNEISKLKDRLDELQLPVDYSNYFVKKAEIELKKIMGGGIDE